MGRGKDSQSGDRGGTPGEYRFVLGEKEPTCEILTVMDGYLLSVFFWGSSVVIFFFFFFLDLFFGFFPLLMVH